MGCNLATHHIRQVAAVNDCVDGMPRTDSHKNTSVSCSTSEIMSRDNKVVGKNNCNAETDVPETDCTSGELVKGKRMEQKIENKNTDNRIGEENVGSAWEDNLAPSLNNNRNEKSSEAESGKLTAEEVENKIQDTLKNLERTILTITTNPYRDFEQEGAPFTKEFRQCILKLAKSYFCFRVGEMPYSSIVQYRVQIAKALNSHGAVRVMCDVLSDGLKRKDYMDVNEEMVNEYWFPIKNILLTLLNFTDCDEVMRVSITRHHDVLSYLVKNLNDWQKKHLNQELSGAQDNLIKWSLSILHNCASTSENVPRLRELTVIQVVLPYLDSHNEYIRLGTISVLALLVNEEEAELLGNHISVFQFIIKKLRKALQEENRKDFGWSALELTEVLGKLARNDANKKILVDEGCLPSLVEMLRSGNDKETKEVIICLWTLSFDKDNKKKMVEEPGLVQTVYEKYRSPDSAQKHDCQGILWSLRDELLKSPEYRTVGEEITNLKSNAVLQAAVTSTASKADEIRKTTQVGGHVMISYQWANQEVIKQICQVLRSHGIPVWIDIDYMGGSTLQAMARAVEDASVVIIAMSQKYKDSPNTRAEAEYAFQQRKKIIPLIMQKAYRPDGWLGLILGTKFYYDFSGKYTFESRMEGLLGAVKVVMKGESLDSEDGVGPRCLISVSDLKGAEQKISVTALGVSPKPARQTSQTDEKSVKKWTKADIDRWLAKHSLQNSSLSHLCGEEIIFLHNLRSEAPEFFYHCLESKLHLTSLLDLSRAASALSDLSL